MFTVEPDNILYFPGINTFSDHIYSMVSLLHSCTKEDVPDVGFFSKPRRSFHLRHVFVCFTPTIESLFFFIIAFSLFLLLE